MNEDQIRAEVVSALHTIAPEVPPERIRPDEDLREQLDLDSMDMVNLLAALEERLGVQIEESDRARLTTLDGAVAYLLSRAAPDRTRSR